MEFVLNGQPRTFAGDPEMRLLTYLREQEGLISPKDGCSSEGVCGTCSVEINGKAMFSCTQKMKSIAGKTVVTLEGLESKRRDIFAHAFAEAGGVQCGFCTPGFVVQADVLLQKNPDPSREQVTNAIHSNLCRCTGYKKIEDAILLAGKAIRTGTDIGCSEASGRVGRHHRKYDFYDTTLGARPFVCDLKAPGMLHAALKFSEHPRARILKIDVSKAEKVPGVKRIFTAEDIPGDRTIGLIIQDWPMMLKEGESTRYIGDILAAVVASTEKIAREACALISVEYEVLKPVTDPFEAMEPSAPKIHQTGNVLSRSEIKRGDVDEVIANSKFVSRGRYTTQRIEHAFLEPECCLAEPIGSGVKVYSQGQGAYEDRKQIAKLLGLPEKQART